MAESTNNLRQEDLQGSLVGKTAHKMMSMFTREEQTPRLAAAVYVDVQDWKSLQSISTELERNPALPVILLSTTGNLDNDAKESAILTKIVRYPNVRCVGILKFITDALAAFDKSRADLLSAEGMKAGLERSRSHIRHDLGHALEGHGGYDKEKLIQRARNELGLQGKDDDVVETVMARDRAIEVAEYMDFPAVCVDWEQTLFKNGALVQPVLDRAKEKSNEKKLPIVVWTGGNVTNVYTELRKAGLTGIHACSKQDCKGLRAKSAIDDTALEQLRAEYGLDAEEFELVVSEGAAS